MHDNDFAVRSCEDNLIGPAHASGLFEDTGRVGLHICGYVRSIRRTRTVGVVDESREHICREFDHEADGHRLRSSAGLAMRLSKPGS